MQKELTIPQRLIVGADFKPRPMMGKGAGDVESQVLQLAQKLRKTGVYIKVNSALRACGYSLIDRIHHLDLPVFADGKYYDIGDTLATDGELLREYKPELITVACSAGLDAMRKFKAELPDTEVLGVTVLTSLTEVDSNLMFSCSTVDAVIAFARLASTAGLDGLISAATEVPDLRNEFGVFFSLNSPAIRPLSSVVLKDGQNPDRIMTPTKAIKAGADRLVVSRPVTQAKDPYEAVMRILEEIAAAA